MVSKASGGFSYRPGLLFSELGGGGFKGARHTLEGDQRCIHPLLHGLQVVVHSTCSPCLLVKSCCNLLGECNIAQQSCQIRLWSFCVLSFVICLRQVNDCFALCRVRCRNEPAEIHSRNEPHFLEFATSHLQLSAIISHVQTVYESHHTQPSSHGVTASDS